MGCNDAVKTSTCVGFSSSILHCSVPETRKAYTLEIKKLMFFFIINNSFRCSYCSHLKNQKSVMYFQWFIQAVFEHNKMYPAWFYIPLRFGSNCILLSHLELTLHFNNDSILIALNSQDSALWDISKARRVESLSAFMLFQWDKSSATSHAQMILFTRHLLKTSWLMQAVLTGKWSCILQLNHLFMAIFVFLVMF